ncbi:DUF4280 domain-containing protein [Novosphingobium sp. FSW06-99]|uniref:DUF4280 domain-containing protein n=1 Tax=Novosphingobium sp. FSW06-99 TaxID=1739113 RepID=UPI00076C18FC|nr:DUF4280 domain-containing protein [Novosphingobium sp. FSW06-99]KUR72070.1 hypothetical protein AQZ49_20500 [Novosphingobium sp. FSW06-99]
MSTPEVTSAAILTCSFGALPVPFNVLPVNRVTACGLPCGTILDNQPMVNVASFGLCTAPTNPEVIALTAAALGTPTPAPCIPALAAPWIPGTPTVTVGGIPALDTGCTLLCTWLGEITVEMPAQMTVTVP